MSYKWNQGLSWQLLIDNLVVYTKYDMVNLLFEHSLIPLTRLYSAPTKSGLCSELSLSLEKVKFVV